MYCNNDTVNYIEPGGHLAITFSLILWAAGIGAAIGTVWGAAYGGITPTVNGQNVWAGIGIGALTGFFRGA